METQGTLSEGGTLLSDGMGQVRAAEARHLVGYTSVRLLSVSPRRIIDPQIFERMQMQPFKKARGTRAIILEPNFMWIPLVVAENEPNPVWRLIH